MKRRTYKQTKKIVEYFIKKQNKVNKTLILRKLNIQQYQLDDILKVLELEKKIIIARVENIVNDKKVVQSVEIKWIGEELK